MKESYFQIINTLLSLENFPYKTEAKIRRKIAEIAYFCQTESDLYRSATEIIIKYANTSTDALSIHNRLTLLDKSTLAEVIQASQLPDETAEDNPPVENDFSWEEFWALCGKEFKDQELNFLKGLATNELIQYLLTSDTAFYLTEIKKHLQILADKSPDGRIIIPPKQIATISFKNPEIFTFSRGGISYTQILRIYEAQRQKKKLQDVAEFTSCSVSTVKKYYKRLGLLAEVGKPPPIEQNKQTQLVQLVSSRISINKSAQILNISRTTARKYCRKFGLISLAPPQGGKPAIPDEKVEEIIRLNKSGYSCPQIATMLNLSNVTVYKYHKELNLTPGKRSRVQITDEKIRQITALKAQGLSISEIARTLRASRGTVRRHLKKRQNDKSPD